LKRRSVHHGAHISVAAVHPSVRYAGACASLQLRGYRVGSVVVIEVISVHYTVNTNVDRKSYSFTSLYHKLY